MCKFTCNPTQSPAVAGGPDRGIKSPLEYGKSVSLKKKKVLYWKEKMSGRKLSPRHVDLIRLDFPITGTVFGLFYIHHKQTSLFACTVDDKLCGHVHHRVQSGCQIILPLRSAWVPVKRRQIRSTTGKRDDKGVVCVAVTYRHPRRGRSECAAL